MNKYVCHFSCGVTSAVATMITLMENPGTTEVIYADPGMENSDNHRFKDDFEKLIKQKITVLTSDKFSHPFEVFKHKRFLSSPYGAPCTTELKKIPITKYLGDRLVLEYQVIGYTAEEPGRIARWEENNPEAKLYCPLVRHDLSKSDCFQIVKDLGLRLPLMYILGYANANCTGCVKAESIGYWAAIRLDFPNVFKWYAKFERQIGKQVVDVMRVKRKGVAINKKYVNGERIRVFLDEIPADFPPKRNVSFSCGYSCGAPDLETIENELTRQPSFNGYAWADKLKELFT